MSLTNKKALGAGAALVALSSFVPNPFLMGQALAQATATDTMDITAKVVNPLGVDQQTKLNFGSFAVNAAPGTFTFNAVTTDIQNGVIVTKGTLGKVNLTAPKSAVFTISIPDLTAATANVILKLNGTGATANKTMKVTAITIDGTAKLTVDGAVGDTYQFSGGNAKVSDNKINDAGGVGAATVGGVLHFIPTQVLGIYRGSYTLLITF